MSRWKTIFLSMVCLIVTTSLYAAQPILPKLAADFHTSLSQMGLFMTFTFFGNGMAQITVIPLADKYERRSLTQVFLLMGASASLLMSFSPSFYVALGAGVLIGFCSSSNMLILSFASGIADKGRKGKVTGSIMGGVLSGILLSRLISASLTELFSWRAVYLVISLCQMVSAAALFRFPKSQNESNEGIQYGRLLRSMVRLVGKERDLRKCMRLGMSGFLVFNFLWTGLTFLLSASPFHFDSFTIGLFGLAGISGILASKRAGALFDRGLGKKVVFYGWMLLGASWLVLMGASFAAPLSVPWAVILLVAGIVMLDAAMQAQHITNQAFILSAHEAEEGRALTVYMACNLWMGSAANLITSVFYPHIHWTGICAVSIVVCGVNIYYSSR